MSRLARSLYTPLSVATGVGGGLLAGAIFGQIWKRIGENDAEPPDPKDLSHSTATVMTAAAIQGLIVGIVRATVQRAGAHGYRAVTHETPPA
ncbi:MULTISPECIES: DUF4235 domain-containing protein [Mycolicibacterium]|nr:MULTISPECIES: DUF4235 domain-containing protein [Mycolicibacterium]MCV7130916.1 DUF4235 domain-containing protein [Mycolicibacterium vanbaalenii PYR-1]MDN4522198.1 DUF4235 domain-containing protein [Mycolicibacterium austroafricanum]MDW5613258.1 DUF4235 domain-containing protein [Mycolicibacterium sp. D5.8-2]PQP40512.1 DUF4235 domain-containing protein [Mycolicibacterium austroafricanum]QRZ05797.1 DUF4235 domain-containing protein [Mycolicibacterium austroafricanum]